MDLSLVIMAGGAGERFWPASRKDRPKQLLSLSGEGPTLIEETWRRCRSVVPAEDIFVSLRQDLFPQTRTLLRDCPVENFILEPLPRDTAAAAGLASVFVEARRPGSVMALLPADQLVTPHEAFAADIRTAAKAARDLDALVTLGIKPDRPDTSYGYIEIGEPVHRKDNRAVHEVKRFVEKPDAKTAETYLRSGRFLWNAGIFVWKPSVFLAELERFLPEHYLGLRELQEWVDLPDFVDRARPLFERFPKISVDYGVMEKARNTVCLPVSFEWDDVGSWSALGRHLPRDEAGNAVAGPGLCHASRNTIAVNRDPSGLVVTLGTADLVVVRTKDVVLVCDRRHEHLLKETLKRLGENPQTARFL